MRIRPLFVKAIISIGLVLFLVWKIDVATLIGTLASVHPNILILSCGLLLIQQGVMVLSWSVLLWSQERELPYHRVLYAHLVGNFFGTLLPSAVGIDIIRAYSLSKHLRRGVDALTSLFLCRTIAFIILFLLALIFTIPVAKLTGSNDMFSTLLVLFLGFLSFLFLTYHPKSFGVLMSLLKRFPAESLAEKMSQFRESLIEISRQRYALWRIIVLTIVFQVLGILVVYLLGLALDVQVELIYYFILIPVIMVVTLIPISIAGIGVREASFVYLFSQVGATEAQGLSLSLLMFFQTILLALIGGLVYWVRDLPKKAEAKPDHS